MSLPPESTIEDIKVRIRTANTNPNVGKIEQVVLKDGPRVARLATLLEIIDSKTGAVHHHVLKIESVDRKKSGVHYNSGKSVTLEGNNPNEIESLFRFLQAHIEGKLSNATGDMYILHSTEYQKLKDFIDAVPGLGSPDVIKLLKHIIPRIKDSGVYLEEFVQAFENSDPQTVEHIAIAAQIVTYKRAFESLKVLVESGNTEEGKYQQLLTENPWMFGSEYSELLDRRKWTRDNSLDFMLRRTSDNYLEVIEIKTPFNEPLFNYDGGHNSYYPSAKLSPVIGQVMHYIAEVERNRDSIFAKDGEDTLKIRARIIIGRDGDRDRQMALRNLNAHLHRIEIITFDQLVRIAGRVLSMFEGASTIGTAKVDKKTEIPSETHCTGKDHTVK